MMLWHSYENLDTWLCIEYHTMLEQWFELGNQPSDWGNLHVIF